MAMDPARLYTQLLNTGLQNKDNPLYQLIYQLIGALVKLNSDASSSGSSSSGSTVINPTTVLGLIGVADNDGESSFIPGPQGNRGNDGNTIIGLDGADGLDAPIIPGPMGPFGPMGIMGPSGIDGIDGDTIIIPGPIGPMGQSGIQMIIESESESETGIIGLIDKLTTEITLTTTGNIDDLNFGNASIIRMNNATISTIRGLKAGVAGQRITIVSIGAGEVHFSNENAGSTASYRLINFVTSCTTPLAAGKGAATYQYDATTNRWRLVSHNQGATITVAFDAANFTSTGGGTAWTVIAANQETYAYLIQNDILILFFKIESTNVTGTPLDLMIKIPNGATVKTSNVIPFQAINAGASNFGPVRVVATETNIRMQSNVAGAGWAATAGSDTFTRGTIFIPIT
jgi:hypothetical protein